VRQVASSHDNVSSSNTGSKRNIDDGNDIPGEEDDDRPLKRLKPPTRTI
jgi:hypothetical protein